MTRVYANAIFCSTRFDFDAQSLRLLVGDTIEPGWPQHIERAYRCALGFSFNDFYLRRIRLQHVLSASFAAGPRLGQVWSDWVLLDDDRLGTRSLHVGFCFPTLRLDLHDRHCAATEAAARFLQDVYQLSERVQSLPGGLGELSRLLCEHGPKRRNALGLSRYVYTSLVCDDASMLAAPSDDVRVNLYRLLFQHARGVDPAVATAMLPQAWSSAAFFRLYAQPGSIVSLAVPYPPDVRSTHAAWFEPTPPQLAPAPFALAHTLGAQPAPYPSYDLLPEYPPLRYLAWAALHYAAAYEETLRAVHEAAFSPLRQRLFRRGPRPKPLIGHLLAANLEGVRLPVVRNLVDRLLDIQLQERTASAAMERLRMRESTQMLLWAVVAAIAGIAAVVLAGLFVDVKNFIFRHEAPAAQSEAAAAKVPAPKPSQP